MSGNVTKLKPKQEEAILALLSNRGMEEAARAVKVTPRTLYRWMKEPAFDAAYLLARRTGYKQGMARLQQSCGVAVSILFKVMADPGTPAAVKVRAVECVLNHSSKSIELEDLVARVAELERAKQEDGDA
jgi:DNA-binding phage protein